MAIDIVSFPSNMPMCHSYVKFPEGKLFLNVLSPPSRVCIITCYSWIFLVKVAYYPHSKLFQVQLNPTSVSIIMPKIKLRIHIRLRISWNIREIHGISEGIRIQNSLKSSQIPGDFNLPPPASPAMSRVSRASTFLLPVGRRHVQLGGKRNGGGQGDLAVSGLR